MKPEVVTKFEEVMRLARLYPQWLKRGTLASTEDNVIQSEAMAARVQENPGMWEALRWKGRTVLRRIKNGDTFYENYVE